ncbi:MAG: D-alanine--D-alanine ligase [Ignavibacteriae bacterium]|nr:D-alanine--D-alanine ligase [Ignavibacteriota bacterium]
MKIALIVGGISSEREVSLASGRGILKALRENGHNVKVFDPIYGEKEVSEDVIFKDLVSAEYPTYEAMEKLLKESRRKVIDCINSSLFEDIDLAFIGLHGKYGEDGRIQSLLDLRGIKYTGSDILSSAVAMDKNVTKIIFRNNNILTPDWIMMTKKDGIDIKGILRRISLPFVIKPNDEGSTVGLTIVKNESDITNAIELAFKYTDKIMIEKYVKGRELTVSIVGDIAYPLIEIKPKEGFYDYHHKYTKGMTEYICPAEVKDEVSIKAQEIALKAYHSLGCSVYSRVDFLLDEKDELHCLEVNTLPGMTELSLVPKAVKAKGMEFNELIENIIGLSLNNY